MAKLYFENRFDKKFLIAEGSYKKEDILSSGVLDLINQDLKNNKNPYANNSYIRWWFDEDLNSTILDFGSPSEFYILEH